MSFAIRLSTRHPRFDFVFFGLTDADFAGTGQTDAIGQFQGLENVLGVCEQLLV